MSQEIYCEIVGKSVGFFKSKVEIEIDFGQETGWFGAKNPLSDSNGKVIKFNSMIDSLNHMAKDGWSFVNAYSLTYQGKNVYHYVMRKALA